MREIALPEKPDDEQEQLFAEIDKLKVEEGLEFDPQSLRAHEFLERKCDTSMVLFDEPVPWQFWKLVARRVKKANTHWTPPDLRESRAPIIRFCRILVKNKVNALSPFRAQQELYDSILLSIPDSTPFPVFVQIMAKMGDGLREFRDACYIEFQKEYLGRQTG